MSEPATRTLDLGHAFYMDTGYGWEWVDDDHSHGQVSEELGRALDRIAGLEDEVRLLRNRIRYSIAPDGDKWRVRDTVVPQSMTFSTKSEAITFVESLTPAVDYPYPDATEATP